MIRFCNPAALALFTLSTLACGWETPQPEVAQPDRHESALTTCALSVSRSDVPYLGTTTFEITASGLPARAASFWNGTKNGVIDAIDQPTFGPASGSFLITNDDPAREGNYVRSATIKDASGATLCTTGSVAVRLQGPAVVASCSLSASKTVVPVGDTTVLTIASTPVPAGTIAYWRGTKDGATDAWDAVTVPAAAAGSFPITNSPGYGGTYQRWAVLKDRSGAVLCETNKVDVVFRS